jgi:hypothetical protein
LPDRNWLALVIDNWLYSLETVASHGPALPRMRMDREPHIGEYDVKTNAVCAVQHTRRHPKQPEARPTATINGTRV